MVKAVLKTVVIFIAIVTLASCRDKRVFDCYYDVASEGWHQDSIVKKEILELDPEKSYDLYLNFKHSVDYEYNNLWIFSNIESDTVLCDSTNIKLSGSEGYWIGSSASGGLFDVRTLVKQDITCDKSGRLFVTIEQGSEDDFLAGVTSVGFGLKESDGKR